MVNSGSNFFYWYQHMISCHRTKHLNILITLIAVIWIAACSPSGNASVATPLVTVTQTALPEPNITTIKATSTSTVTPEPTVTATATSTSTPDPYQAYTIDYLVSRGYGGGELRAEEVMAVNSYFTRTLVSYPSDRLRIYGFMNTPRRVSGESGEKLPVVIALHGYIDPAIYTTLDYTTRYADALAREGFIVLHPNLRGYAPSDDGENLFRVGMAVDVLNLIATIKEQAGQPGPLEDADPALIGIWGHSMGGGISTRVITVSEDVRAAVLYGAMSADDQKNFERIYQYFSNRQRGIEELSASQEAFQRISPIHYLERIQAAVSIHHGEHDPDVPLAWSLDLCQQLIDLGKVVECFTYDGQPHTFHDEGDQLFIQRIIEFYTKWLKAEDIRS